MGAFGFIQIKVPSKTEIIAAWIHDFLKSYFSQPNKNWSKINCFIDLEFDDVEVDDVGFGDVRFGDVGFGDTDFDDVEFCDVWGKSRSLK